MLNLEGENPIIEELENEGMTDVPHGEAEQEEDYDVPVGSCEAHQREQEDPVSAQSLRFEISRVSKVPPSAQPESQFGKKCPQEGPREDQRAPAAKLLDHN